VNRLTLALATGVAALFVSGASAAPLNPTSTAVGVGNGIENVRMVCDQYGRCWRERGQRRVQRESYGYDYDRGRRGQRYYDDRPGVGIQVPGVSIGVGGGRW
jgi:hypothetical protein